MMPEDPDDISDADMERLAKEIKSTVKVLNRAIQIAEHHGLEILARIETTQGIKGVLPCVTIVVDVLKEIGGG